jgi:hypothetical protein
LPETDVPGFIQALNLGVSAPLTDHETSVWSPPRYDPDDAFVYVAGPCWLAENLPGYLPTTTFTVAHGNLAGLSARLTVYLQEHDRNAADIDFRRRLPRARSST